MRDEDFEYFISKFGEATQRTKVPIESIEKWRGKLPEQLLTYWQEEGWCGYADGRFWTVNPDDYEDSVREWLEGTPLEKIDEFHVIARTAFGGLCLFGIETGASVRIAPAIHVITALKRDLKPKAKTDLEQNVRNLFAFYKITYCDLDDESGEPLFERALEKLGPLKADEVYGFEPALIAGGKMRLENLAKLNLDVHLTILRKLAPPTMPFSNIDIDKLMNS